MSLLSPLHDKRFFKLYISRSFSLLGTGVGRIALAFFAYRLAPQHASIVLGVALVINMLTYIIMAPLYGHFSTKIPRKIFLVGMDIIRALLLLIVPFVTEVWQVYLLVFLINVCSAGFTPLYQALIPEVLQDEKRYSQALLLTRVTYNVETLLSPALSALLLIDFSFHSLFVLNAATYLLSALLLLTVSFPVIQSKSRLIKMHVLSGIKLYVTNPMLLGCLALVMLSTLAGATAIVNTVVFFHGLFAQTQSVAARALFFFGAGSVLFALLMPKLRLRFSEQGLMLLGALVIIVTYFLASFTQQWWHLLIVWFFLGIGTMAIEGLLSVVVNNYATIETRAALFAANFSLTHACWLLGYLLVALLGHSRDLLFYFMVLLLLSIVLLFVAGYILRLTKKRFKA